MNIAVTLYKKRQKHIKILKVQIKFKGKSLFSHNLLPFYIKDEFVKLKISRAHLNAHFTVLVIGFEMLILPLRVRQRIFIQCMFLFFIQEDQRNNQSVFNLPPLNWKTF